MSVCLCVYIFIILYIILSIFQHAFWSSVCPSDPPEKLPIKCTKITRKLPFICFSNCQKLQFFQKNSNDNCLKMTFLSFRTPSLFFKIKKKIFYLISKFFFLNIGLIFVFNFFLEIKKKRRYWWCEEKKTLKLQKKIAQTALKIANKKNVKMQKKAIFLKIAKNRSCDFPERRSEPPENCHFFQKIMPFFSQKLQQNCHFFLKNCHFFIKNCNIFKKIQITIV